MQQMNEVMTAVREDVNANVIIFNNMEWGAEMQNQYWFYNERFVGTELPDNPNFAEIAEGMGGNGIRVEDPDEIGDAVEEMFESDTTTVAELMTDGTELLEPFRRDALDDPERILEKYQQPGDPNYDA
jgi:sulfoacetaldehyde acetyltransferase